MTLIADNPALADAVERPTFFTAQTDGIARSANGIFILVTVLGLAAFLIWAALTSIEDVTRANGRVIPTAQNQNVQHMEGGIIADILVSEGDMVEAGDTLLRVENSFSGAELAQMQVDLLARQLTLARLNAEVAGATAFSPDANANVYPELVAGEIQLFQRRQENLKEQLGILEDQAEQQRLALVERQTRLVNKQQEFELMEQQVASLADLVMSGAASRNSLLERQSQLQQIRTQIDDLRFQIPQYESGLSEVLRRSLEAQLQFRSDAETQRSETQVEIVKIEQTIAAMSDRSERTNVMAPLSGRINRLLVSTIGGVVQPGQTLVQIVPADASISIEAKVSPRDRGDIYLGLESVIKVSAYNYSIYGGLRGKIVEISPDALQDDDGEPYFRVRIEASSQSFGPDHPVVPGMLAEVNVLTGSSTVLDYLLNPLRRLSENALRQ